MAAGRRGAVCLLSFHPLLLPEFERLLLGEGFRLLARRVEPDRAPDPQDFSIPRASVYVVEAQANRQVTEALVGAVLGRHRLARLLVLAEEFTESNAFSLLRLGARGLLRYSEVPLYLPRALREVARGGFWVPRALLSRFVDLTRGVVHYPLVAPGSCRLSRREREVGELLLENLSNKEIASKLAISERTAKFHVSNLLAKYGVKRRANVILLSFAQPKPVGIGPWALSKEPKRFGRWSPPSASGRNELSVRTNPEHSRSTGGDGEQQVR